MSEIQNIPAPDTHPEKLLGVPNPPSPPNPLPSTETLKSWLPLYLHKTDNVLEHLSRVLATPAGTDSVLMTIGYGSLLTSTVLTRLSMQRLRRAAQGIIDKAIALPPNTTVLLTATTIPSSNLLILASRLKALSALIADVRIFARIFGLVSIYKWSKSVLATSPNTLFNQIAYAQVFVNFIYQVLENGAYLSSKGVLGWSEKTQGKAWVWSSRCWMAHVGLDFLRLWKEWDVRRKARGEKGLVESEVEDQWWSTWKRELVVNSAYAPLTLHWSLETGLIEPFWVGFFGSIAGGLSLRQKWKLTS